MRLGRYHQTMLRAFVSSAALIALAACSTGIRPDTDANPEGNVGAACTDSIECQAPMTYLIRSSCPFSAMCVEGSCAVVCPMMTMNPHAGGNEPVQCGSDTDCDCGSYGAGDMKRCSCVQGLCVAVMDE
jgi:hypothetical protein